MSQAPLPPQSAPSSSTFPPHMDSAILSIAHSPPTGVESPGSTELALDGTTQRKITLLTRPLQPQTSTQGTSDTSTGTFSHTQPLPSSISQTLASDLQSQQQGSAVGGLPPSFLPQATLPQATLPMTQIVAGIRAARNDYFDTEDPSVNLHEFIINSLQAQKNRVILLKLEEEFLSYVSDPNRLEPLKLPPWDSYHRMLAHRVAAYFGLEHNVDPMDRTCVVVCKGPNSRIPQIRFSSFLPTSVEEVESAEPKLILKRSTREMASTDKFDTPLSVASSSEVKSFEEREEEYEKARARIFSQQSTGGRASISFDLGTPRRGSSIFSHAMHHRRTASDTATAMLSRPSTELKKEGPSSSHSSRSATPLISTLLRQSQETSPPQPPAPLQPLLPLSLQLPLQTQAQQQKHQPATESSQQAQLQQQQQQHQQQQQQTQQQIQQQSQQQSQQRTQFKYSWPQQPQTQTQAQAQRVTATGSLQFQPIQGMPVIYPQPAMVPDPNWYYNNMMLYPVSPQSYIPAQYAQVVQPPVFQLNQQYSVAAPGVIGQPAMISPPVTRAGIRLPIVTPQGTLVEPMTSPTVPSAVTLVRPVPQQASPVRLPGKTDSSLWSNPQSFPLQQPVAAMPGNRQTAFTIVPVTQDSTHQLAEQMEQSLTMGSATTGMTDRSCPPGDSDVGVIQQSEKQGMSSVGQQISQRFPMGQKQPQPSTLQPQSMNLHSHPNGGNSPGSSYSSTTRNVNVANSGGVYSIMPGMESMGGQMMSPTQVRGVQFMHPHPQIFSGGQDPQLVGSQHHMPHNHPGSLIQYPSGMPQSQGANQPTTPPVGPMNLPPQSLIPGQQHQGIFSPPSTGVTHSPIQILGHTLGTSLFSPPPSSTAPHGVFVNSPTTSGKVLSYAPGTPTHPPVGSGPRFRRYNSPNQGSHLTNSISPHSQSPGPNISQNQLPQDSPIAQHKQFASTSATNGTSTIPGSSFQPLQLPPRLVQQQQQQQQQRNTGTRYQNQRHPANRGHSVGAKGPTLGDHMPSQFMPGPMGSPAMKREPLLPTPPSTQMVKLDTTLTCGVPLNVMEVLSFPPEGSLERQQAGQALREMGLQDFKAGRLSKTGEEVLVAVFSSPETAIKALHIKHPHFTLSIPRNNHAKFILSLLQVIPPQ